MARCQAPRQARMALLQEITSACVEDELTGGGRRGWKNRGKVWRNGEKILEKPGKNVENLENYEKQTGKMVENTWKTWETTWKKWWKILGKHEKQLGKNGGKYLENMRNNLEKMVGNTWKTMRNKLEKNVENMENVWNMLGDGWDIMRYNDDFLETKTLFLNQSTIVYQLHHMSSRQNKLHLCSCYYGYRFFGWPCRFSTILMYFVPLWLLEGAKAALQCFVRISHKSASTIPQWSSTILSVTHIISCCFEPLF